MSDHNRGCFPSLLDNKASFDDCSIYYATLRLDKIRTVTASILDYPDKYKYPLQLSLSIEFFVSKVLFKEMDTPWWHIT